MCEVSWRHQVLHQLLEDRFDYWMVLIDAGLRLHRLLGELGDISLCCGDLVEKTFVLGGLGCLLGR